MLVKLISYAQKDFYGDYDDCLYLPIVLGITDWEDITEDDYIKVNEWITKRRRNHDGVKYVLVQQHNMDIPNKLSDLAKWEAEEEKKRRYREKELARQKAEAQKKKEANKKARELKKLKQLQEKYGAKS